MVLGLEKETVRPDDGEEEELDMVKPAFKHPDISDRNSTHTSEGRYTISHKYFKDSPSDCNEKRFMLSNYDIVSHWLTASLYSYAKNGFFPMDVIPEDLRQDFPSIDHLKKACEKPVVELVNDLEN